MSMPSVKMPPFDHSFTLNAPFLVFRLLVLTAPTPKRLTIQQKWHKIMETFTDPVREPTIDCPGGA
jgi:hypothetical protein